MRKYVNVMRKCPEIIEAEVEGEISVVQDLCGL